MIEAASQLIIELMKIQLFNSKSTDLSNTKKYINTTISDQHNTNQTIAD
jgi:hypothetical protein